MKKYTPAQLVRMLAMPALTVILGLILLLSPDSASALVGQVLAWVTILAAVALGAGSIFGSAVGRNGKTVAAVVCGVAGVWMLLNPLFMARILGRILGTFLLLRGLQMIREHMPPRGSKLAFSPALGAATAVTVLGIALILVPMTASRAAFSILGVILIGVGVAEGFDRIRGRNLLEEGSDPNIIDVEKI